MRLLRHAILLVVPLVFASFLVPACTANLEEGCLGGDCVPPGTPPIPAPWPTSGGGGGGGADGGDGGLSCMNTSPTGDFPCEVFAALQTNCHTCHQSPPLNGAPFSLLTYEDTQQPFGTLGQLRWQRMLEVVDSGFMPLGKTITPADKQVLLDWLNGCAQPAATGMGCE